MGGFLESHARNCQWHAQLVCAETVSNMCYLTSGHSQLLNEIMPMIYKRFTEKAAEEWRQIYKVLILRTLFEDHNLRALGPATSRVPH